VAVAITQLGGVQGPVAVDTVVAVVTVPWMMSVIVVVVVRLALAPVTVIMAVVEVAVFDITNVSVECTEPPEGGVTGFGLKPPETPAGSVATSATGELKPL
jgi:hypothetical protein